MNEVTNANGTSSKSEQFEVKGEDLMGKVRDLAHEAGVRRIILKRDDGSALIEIPLPAGLAVTVLTAAVAPVLVAVGAVAALLSKVTLVVERDEDDAAV
jgi:hypothetical protein